MPTSEVLQYPTHLLHHNSNRHLRSTPLNHHNLHHHCTHHSTPLVVSGFDIDQCGQPLDDLYNEEVHGNEFVAVLSAADTVDTTSTNKMPAKTTTAASTPHNARHSSLSSAYDDDHYDAAGRQALRTAVHVLQTEAEALMSLKELYAHHPVAKKGFTRAVAGIAASQKAGGKLVVVGVGKSGKIGQKIESTMNSLGLLSMFMNPVEALHGDLGILRPNDIIILITFSGNTPELLNLLPHIPAHLPVIALTAHTSYQTLKLTQSRSGIILLPAPIPESEQSTFDLCAPTTSTTVALALGDALALAVARVVHVGEGHEPKDVFRRHHPGGAIGKSAPTLLDLAVPLSDMATVDEPALPVSPPLSAAASDADGESESDCDWSSMDSDASSSAGTPATSTSSGGPSSASTSPSPSSPAAASAANPQLSSSPPAAPSLSHKSVLQCLTLAIRSRKGWLRLSSSFGVIPPRRLQTCQSYEKNIHDVSLGLVVNQSEWVKIPANTAVEDMKRRILAARAGTATGGEGKWEDGTVIAATLDGLVIGVLEVEDILEDSS